MLFLREVWRHLTQSFGAQSYYAVGLILQKGLPYLLIPVLIRVYGEHTYASYVLFYTSTLMFANLLALAIPNSVITFWYTHRDKETLCWTFILMLIIAHAVSGAVFGGIIYHLYCHSFEKSQAAPLALLTVLFAIVYNFNSLLTGICRARNWSKGYFCAQVLAALVLLFSVALSWHRPRLEVLIGSFLISIVCQDLYLTRSIWQYLRRPFVHVDKQLAKQVLWYCIPMVPHLEATVFYNWIDKYLVSLYFPAERFSLFTISFQYAFMQAFFAQIFAMHTFPLICRLTGAQEQDELRSVLRSYNLVLASLGLAWIGFVLLLYRVGAQVHIDPFGFALLGGAFLLWNVAGNYINVLWARFRTGAVTVVMLGAGLVFLATMVAGCWVQDIFICYAAHLACAGAALLGFVYLEAVTSNSRTAVAMVPGD